MIGATKSVWSLSRPAFAGLLLLGCIAQTASAFAEDITLSDSPELAFDPYADLPQSEKLSSLVRDDEGNPIRGATISIGGKVKAKSAKKTGAFTLEDPVAPTTLLVVEHPRLARRIVRAGDLMTVDGPATPVHLVPYTSYFNITPAGGIYTSGELTLEVPPGAVSKNVKVLAANLPLDFAYNNDGEVEPMRLSAVDLKPHGLKFAKPVTLTMTVAREDLAAIVDPVGFGFDEKKNRHVLDESTKIKVVGQRISMTLSHFSTHSTGDGKAGRSIKELGRGTDVDGDGKETPSDAFFILMASGGTHEADGTYSQSVSGAVMEETSKTKGSSSSKSVSGSAGFSFKGASFGVSGAVSRDRAKEVAERFSQSQEWAQDVSASVEVRANEYEFKCQMVLGRHVFSRAVEWKRIEPGPTEMEAIQNHWNSKKRPSGKGKFEFFDYQAPTKITAGRTLSGNKELAVAKTADGLAVFVKETGYIIARLKNLTTKACTVGTGDSLPGAVDKAGNGTKNKEDRQTAMEKKFRFGTSSGAPSGKAPWGTLNPERTAVFIDKECPQPERQTWGYTIKYRKEKSDTKDKSGSDASESGNTVGGFGGSMTATKADVKFTKSSTGKGQSSEETKKTTVNWLIAVPHVIHYSDHIVAWLFKQTPEGQIPFGLLMLRIAERPCGSQVTPSPTPGTPTPGGPVPTAPKPGPAGPTGPTGPEGGGTTTETPRPRPDGPSGPTEPTPPASDEPPIDVPSDEDVPEGESTQDPGAPPDARTREELARDEASESYKEALAGQGLGFTSLTGLIIVDTSRVGVPVTVTAADEKGKPIPVRSEIQGDNIQIEVQEGTAPVSIVIKGLDDTITLRSGLVSPKDFELSKIKPQPVDGMIDVANGFTKETVFVPEGVIDMNEPLSDHFAELGGTPVDVYAARPGELAFVGSGITPSSDGETWMSVAGPDGDTASGAVPAWSYEIGAQPSTRVNTWAPVYFRCTGLAATERISIALTPRPWQSIEMFHSTVTCGQASDFVIVAQYSTTRVGPQEFNATIKRLED